MFTNLKKINKCGIVFGPTYEDSQQVAKSSPERFLYIIFIMCHPSKGPIGSVRSEVKFDLLSIFNQKHFCHLSRVLGCKCDCFGIRSSLPSVELSLDQKTVMTHLMSTWQDDLKLNSPHRTQERVWAPCRVISKWLCRCTRSPGRCISVKLR